MFKVNVKNIKDLFKDPNVSHFGSSKRVPTVWPKYSTVPQILATARGHGLNVFCVSETPGDGNCFYRAIVEQLNDRTDLGDVSALKLQYANHHVLRQALVEFVRQQGLLSEEESPFIVQYKNYFNNGAIDIDDTTRGFTWGDLLNQQKRDTVYTTEVFIKATAVLLGKHICINSETCNVDTPLRVESCFWENHLEFDENMPASSYFLLAGINNNHFQSLLPGNGGILANVNHQESVDFSIENVGIKRKREPETRNDKFMQPSSKKLCSKQKQSKGSVDAEIEIRERCTFYGVEYVAPCDNESVSDRRKRRRSLRCKTTNMEKRRAEEGELEISCVRNGIKYNSPVKNESARQKKNRRYQMNCLLKKQNIQNNVSTKNIVSTKNVIESSVSNQRSAPTSPTQTCNGTEGVESSDNYLHTNPRVVEAASVFEEGELKHSINQCIICNEVRPVFYDAAHVEPKLNNNDLYTPFPWSVGNDGKCDRCRREEKMNRKRKNPSAAPKFSGIFTESENDENRNTGDGVLHNNMHFEEVPPYLKNLSILETAMISKINIITNITILKYGMLKGKGHSIAIPNDMKIAKTLPNLPQEVGIILLRKKGETGEVLKEYIVRREKVEQALKGLVFGYPHGGVEIELPNYKIYDGPDHINFSLKGRYFEWLPNPFYFDVIIDSVRLGQLPVNGEEICPGVPNLEFKTDIPNLNKNLSEGQAGSSDLENTHSGIVTPLEPNDVNRNLEKLLEKLIDDEETVENVVRLQRVRVAELSNTRHDLVPERKTCGFFTMAFPTIFINGSADITIPQLTTPDYQEWVDHIYHCSDNRVSSHPTLRFFLLNLGLRERALNQGSFIVAQQLHDAHLSVEELRANLENEDQSVPRKLIGVSAKFANSDPYWRDRKIELDSLVLFRKIEYGDLPAYFDTNSMAENHWYPLKQLLARYESFIKGVTFESVKEKIENDFSYHRKLVLSNLHIVTKYFEWRTLNYYKTVGKELFQTSDMWIRYEFAKGRGEIHSHAIIFSQPHAKKIENAMSLITDDGKGNKNTSDAAVELHNFLQTDSQNADDFHSPNFVSMHPAGGHDEIDESGNRVWLPNKSEWPKPDGDYEPPDFNPLSEKLSDHSSHESMRDFHIALANKVGLHKCNNTCLKLRKKGSKSKYCRFHFGRTDTETKLSEGKETHPFHSVITPGEHPRFEGNRDHPFLISHIKARLLTWCANSDTQAIIDQDLLALLRYITQYACKGAASTDDFIRLYKHLLDVNSDVTSIRSIAQQLLMKIIGMIDMPAASVDFLNCGGHLFHCTRQFRRIGLSGFRVLNSNTSDGVATKETPLERFLSPKRRKQYPNITLYKWAQICICSPKCGKSHVPLFTGLPTLPVWPLNEDYCKGQLMIHSPGTWQNVDELKNGKESFLESFMEFLESDLCPAIVKELVKNAKKEHDKKVERDGQRANRKKDKNDPTESSSEYDSESDDEFEREIRNENDFLQYLAENRPQDFEDLNAFRDLPDGGENFDWHQYATESFGGNWPDGASDWLENISPVAEERLRAQNQDCDLPPNIDLLKANALQRVIIAINILNIMSVVNNENHDKVRLLIQGTAGSGKTFTIVALTYLSRRICNRNNAVMNLAPTGAASILLPLGRTVHSTTSIPRVKKKDSKTLQLADKPLNSRALSDLRKLTGSTLEGDSMKLMTLNLDERGMYSNRVLAWCSQRFREATCDFLNNFGAIPTVNFFGDLGQLGPVGSKDLHIEPLSSDAPDKLAGYGIYRTFSHCIVLNETMRQGPDQISFLEMLLRIREGKLNLDDWKTINSRYEGELPESVKADFDSETCLTVMETWQEVNVENHNKLADLGVPVATVPSKGKGRHHTQSVNQMGQIPATSHIAVGSRVLLTKNQLSLTPLGLNNGAIGKVIAILYKKDTCPPAFPEAVVVDFPRYKGPSWIPEHPTWVPIPVNETRCDTNCCSRMGLPLMPGYCIPISKSQGMTIGPNETCTHIRIKLNKEIFMEKLNLGITYTALSRASKLENVALIEKVPYDRLQYINNHPWMPHRREEEKRLKVLSEETLQMYGHYSDLNTYRELLCQFDRFVNDGLTCFQES